MYITGGSCFNEYIKRRLANLEPLRTSDTQNCCIPFNKIFTCNNVI